MSSLTLSQGNQNIFQNKALQGAFERIARIPLASPWSCSGHGDSDDSFDDSYPDCPADD